MHAQEIILFVSVVVLAAALVIVVVAPRVRNNLRGLVSPHAAHPTDGPERPGGTALASHGAANPRAPQMTPTVSATMPVAPAPPAAPSLHMICPTCRRHFAPGLRYCPYDARVLTPDLQHAERGLPAKAIPVNAAKICPHCSRRYETVAVVCGRDGTALVSVN